MAIPQASSFPTAFDTNENLFLVHDSLRVKLVEDYSPGDTEITVLGEPGVMDQFPDNGIITLTEQCSEPDSRAISLHYDTKTDTTFEGLELMPGFTDVVKPKNVTNVTMNVYADHHNAIKDAVIAIQTFVGIDGAEATSPNGSTLVSRLNFLRRIALSPRAWFSANRRIGIVPVTVTFKNESVRSPTSYTFDFGDGSSPSEVSVVSEISSTSTSSSLTEVLTTAVSCGTNQAVIPDVTHTYTTPGVYDVTLTVANQFGQDSVTISKFFAARNEAPDEATISISPTKVGANALVNLTVTDDGSQLGDAITEYTWNLGDDLTHPNSDEAVAIYSVGGIYDIALRTDSTFGSYRITTVEDAINVVEQTNLYLLSFDSSKSSLQATKSLESHEFGLLSETFKTNVMPSLSVTRDYTFITSGYPNRTWQRDTFLRNVSFAHSTSAGSGDGGKGILFWAEDSTTIRYKEMDPFAETWGTPSLATGETQTVKWNWLGLSRFNFINILFGLDSVTSSPTDVSQTKYQHELDKMTLTTDTFDAADYINNADELLTLNGSVPARWRGATWGLNYFISRNDAGPGEFFRIASFYHTLGDASDWTQQIRKLPDIPGTTKTELELVDLSAGVYVFNNSGEIAQYDPTTNVWATGGPGIGSAAFRSLQDTTVDDFANQSQTLRAASDGNRLAYLSFDYSPNAFIKFNEADLTFSALPARPNSNEQFVVAVY